MTQPTPQTKSKELIRPMPATWWLKRKTYTLFMLREATSLFVGGYAIFLLALVWKAGDKEAFTACVESCLKHPLSILLHLLALGMVTYHSVTWFNLTPKAMVVRIGEEKVSPVIIAGSNYLVWILVSFAVLWFALS